MLLLVHLYYTYLCNKLGQSEIFDENEAKGRFLKIFKLRIPSN